MAHWAAATHPKLGRLPTPGYRLVHRPHSALQPEPLDDRATLLTGLFAEPARIAPKYFYDPLGCALFNAICELPEYYPTRTEWAIFAAHCEAMVARIGLGRQFVDLGAGDCAKGAFWLPLLQPRRYVAVDIAAAALEPALARLAAAFPDVELTGVVTDFSRSLDLAADLDAGPATFFYPGSSIGNFSPAEAVELLTEVRRLCGHGGGLFIGVDTEKEPARLHAAYDDALGVTAAFNRNVLNHVNALIGADFDPAAFAHIAFYNVAQRRIEMHLEARSAQRVRIAGRERMFAKGERIHTENSYKYAPEAFTGLLRRAGFVRISMWQDPAGDFAVFYAD